MKRVLCAALALTIAVCFSACGKGTADEAQNEPELSESSLSMVMGDTYTLDILNYEGGAEWLSSDESVASVDERGEVAALSEGSAVITAKADGTEDMSCVVTVSKGTSSVESVTVTSYYSSSSDITINYADDGFATLRASCLPQAAGEKLLWASDNEDVATVDSQGNVTAHANGIANITATALNGVFGSCTIRVKNAPTDANEETPAEGVSEYLPEEADEEWTEEPETEYVIPQSSPFAQSRIKLSTDEVYISVAENYQMTIEASNMPEGTYVDWESSDDTVAIVKYGNIIGIGNGIAVITAKTSDGAVAGCYVAVGKAAKKELREILSRR